MKVRIKEEYTTYLVREAIEIDADLYPELEGMDEMEARDYISENGWDMPAPEGYEEYSSLSEALESQDIVREKIYGEESVISVERQHEEEE
jgi:hypothetical protein